MQIGMVGLGCMGSNMVRRLMRELHPCDVHNRHAEAVSVFRSEDADGTAMLEEFVAHMTKRAVWLMVLATVVKSCASGCENAMYGGARHGFTRFFWQGGNTFLRSI